MTQINIIKKATLLLTVLSFSLIGCDDGKTDFVFPQDFRGWAVYIANQPEGHEPLLDDRGRYIVSFPQDGIFLSSLPIPKGRNNEFYCLTSGKPVKLSVMLEPKNDSLKLCNIIPTGGGFSVNSFKEELGMKSVARDTFLEYDLIYFNVNTECESSESFDSFQNKVKLRLISLIEDRR